MIIVNYNIDAFSYSSIERLVTETDYKREE
jgi:hypothetical protein